MADVKNPPASSNETLPQWKCEVLTSPKEEKGFTVGEVFELQCEGEQVSWVEPLRVELPEGAEYGLVLLRPLQLKPNQIRYEATSYRVGLTGLPALKIIDKEGHAVSIAAPALTLQSVIDPQKPPEGPLGPVGALTMPWPVWIFFAAFLVLLVLIGWFVVYLRQSIQKGNLTKNIRKYQTPLGSYNQFSKDLRTIKRAVVFSSHQSWTPEQVKDFLQKLNESYRLFLLREFVVPATTWKTSLVMKEIKRKSRRAHRKFIPAVTKALRELDGALAKSDALGAQDCEQLATICWQAVDLVWKTKKESSKGGQV